MVDGERNVDPLQKANLRVTVDEERDLEGDAKVPRA
jgi:hypothetical protein